MRILERLLVAGAELEELLRFTVEGVHSYQQGAGDQDWGKHVAKAVGQACASKKPFAPVPAWYAVHLRWFAMRPQGKQRKDLENFHLRPISDRLIVEGFWPEDNINYLRAIYSEVVLVDKATDQRVEVVVYGIRADDATAE